MRKGIIIFFKKISKIFTKIWFIIGILFLILAIISIINNNGNKGLIIAAVLLTMSFLSIPLLLKNNLKDAIIGIMFLIALSVLETSAINMVFISFFFNLVYINLFFDYKWNEKEERINNAIINHKQGYILDYELFNRMKKQVQIETTILIYSLTVLPSLTLDLIIKKKDFFVFLILKFDITKDVYYSYLNLTKDTFAYNTEVKKLIVAVPLFTVFLIFDLILFLISEQIHINNSKIKDNKNRDESYWKYGPINLTIEDLAYVIIDSNYEQPKIPSVFGNKCPYNGNSSEYEIACDECENFLFCFKE